jgi:hypothetical protein
MQLDLRQRRELEHELNVFLARRRPVHEMRLWDFLGELETRGKLPGFHWSAALHVTRVLKARGWTKTKRDGKAYWRSPKHAH